MPSFSQPSISLRLPGACWGCLLMGIGLWVPVPARAEGGSAFDLLLGNIQLLFDRDTNFVFVPPPEVVKNLARDFGHLVAQRNLSAEVPLGAGRIELGVSIESVQLAHKDLWLVTTGEPYQEATLPRLQLKAGLPYGVNAGLSYYRNPSSHVSLQGVTIAKQLVEAKGYLPSLAVGLGTSWIRGVSGLTFKTHSLQVIAAKPMRWATPFVGLGFNQFRGRYADPDGFALQMKADSTRRFIGLESSIGSLALTIEMGDERHAHDAGLKLAWRF